MCLFQFFIGQKVSGWVKAFLKLTMTIVLPAFCLTLERNTLKSRLLVALSQNTERVALPQIQEKHLSFFLQT